MDTTPPHDLPAVAPTTPAPAVAAEVLEQVAVRGDLAGSPPPGGSPTTGASARAWA
jgi:hypothetical protein